MTFASTLLAALFLSAAALPSGALAADLLEPDPVPMEIPEAAQDDHFFYFDVAGSIGIVIPQNSFGAGAPLNAGGRFQDEIGYGGSLEAGAFVTTNIHFSAELVYGKTIHDQ